MPKNKINIPTWGKILIAVIVYAIFVYCYVHMFWSMGIDSDYSNLILEAKDIVNGNVFLNGWTQTGISFLTTDMLYYIIAVAVQGITEESYWLASSLMTVTMLFSAFPLLITGQKRNYKLCEWILFFGICAFPSVTGINLLRAHTGVYVWCFIALACFYKIYFEESDKKVYPIIFVLSVIFGCIGDAIIYIILIAPIFLVCARDFFSNYPTKRKQDFYLTGLTIGAVVLAVILEKIYYFVGSAEKNSFLEIKKFEDFANYPSKLNTYLHAVLGLNHADFTQQSLVSVETVFLFLNVLLVFLGYVVLFLNIRDYFQGKKTDIVAQVLSLGFLLISVVFIITDVTVDINSARYIGTCPVIFAILLVRYMRIHGFFKMKCCSKKISIRSVAMLLGLVILIHNGISASGFSVAVPEQKRLEEVLEENGLHRGYANFWDSSVITVLSNSKVKVRPISIEGTAKAVEWATKDSWYGRKADFVIIRNPEWNGSGVTYENSVAVFGNPIRVIDFENYKIMVYNYNISEKIEQIVKDE